MKNKTNAKSTAKSKTTQALAFEKPRKYLSQGEVPALGLESALRIVQAIADNYACQPTKPLGVAQALNMSPTSGTFRALCGAAIAYGLTEGGYSAVTISLTALGKKIVKPLNEGDDLHAKREAVLQPKIVGDFLKKYDNNRIPKKDIALNVLESMGVPSEAKSKVFELILSMAKTVGFLKEIKGELYVDLQTINVVNENKIVEEEEENTTFETSSITTPAALVLNQILPSMQKQQSEASITSPTKNNRVFITHGKNRSIVPTIQDILKFGNFEPVISVQRESVSKPVPDKVMDDMRSCGAAIIHVEAEKQLQSEDGTIEAIINPNVLIEIGAAMALYGRRFILLVQEGVKLPSNLQGLYEVRYEGDKLDANITIKLIKAFNDFKNYDLNQHIPKSSTQVELSPTYM